MATSIRIDDLARPQLNEIQQGALAYGETLKVDLGEEAVLKAARNRTGLSDFGPADFRVRLRLLCSEWDEDRALTGLHRSVLHGYLVRYASNRLLIQDTLKKHPEILTERIERPVIVTGLPRSGTTYLVNLLAADDRFHSLPLWESYEPVSLPGEAPLPDGTDPRYARCAAAWAGMQQVTPLLAAMHPMEPDHIHEELELMGPDFASYNFEWLTMAPRWRDHYYATDQTPHYEYMKRVLQLLQWQRGGAGKRWLLKCPQHLEQLPLLLRVFSDATIVFTHRDPVAVIQSTLTMQAYTQRIQRPVVEIAGLRDYWIDRIEHLLRVCVRDRGLVPAERSFDCSFHRFMSDVWSVLDQVYAKAQLPVTSEARARLIRYMADHRRGKSGQVVYDLKGDFGVDPATLHERFQFYFDRFPVRAETT
jgi:Sulfotransferase family